MIKIHFEEPNAPDWKKWRKECEKATKELIALSRKGQRCKISNLYKRKQIKNKYYLSIGAAFHGKCAYCETRIVSDQYGDIEHYRPKNQVTDENGDNIEVEDNNGQTISHPGYYWLAYDWKNLLLSCELCNRPNPGNKSIGKQNKFPLKGTFRAVSPGEEVKEQPLLINPLTENPEEHLKINVKTGILGGDERGQCCIRVFGLNEREGLLKARVDAYAAVLGQINMYFASKDETESKNCLRNLCEIISGKSPYSLVGKTLIKQKSTGLFEDLSKACTLFE